MFRAERPRSTLAELVAVASLSPEKQRAFDETNGARGATTPDPTWRTKRKSSTIVARSRCYGFWFPSS